MRISNSHAYQATIDNLSRRQQSLADAQEHLSTGRRVITPGDDPAAAARAERALAVKMRAEADQRSLQMARGVMEQAEGALGDAGEVLQQARELVVSAGNGSFSDRERAGVADALRALRNRLLALSNRDDGAGQVLFGGAGSTRTPFVDAPGGVRFDGQSGEAVVIAGEALPVALDGRNVFLSARDPATGQDNLSAFDALQEVADALALPGRTSQETSAAVRNALGDIDALGDHIGRHRARLGDGLGRADALDLRLSQRVTVAQGERSNAEDLDMVQAISDFQNQQNGYDAALRTYATVQRLSLFDYIGR